MLSWCSDQGAVLKGLWTPTCSAQPDAWATEGMSLCRRDSVAEDRAARTRWKLPQLGCTYHYCETNRAMVRGVRLEAVYQPGRGRV